MEWTPAGSVLSSHPLPTTAEHLTSDRSHTLRYSGDVKESRIVLPPNSNGLSMTAMPTLSLAAKETLVHHRQFSHALNHLRPIDAAGGVLDATADNSCVCIWLNAERSSVKYAHGKGQLRTRSGYLLYDGEFVDGYKHGLGAALLLDTQRGLGRYTGSWKYGMRDGWGKFVLDSVSAQLPAATVRDGTSYEGFWKFDQLNGIVRVLNSLDGSVYTGMYRNHRREGVGRFQWPSGFVEDRQYSAGSIVARMVYPPKSVSATAAPAATESNEAVATSTSSVPLSLGSSAPDLPFIDAFLKAKAAAPKLPDSPAAPSTPFAANASADAALESLTGPLKLPDKILIRTVDETICANVSKELSGALKKPTTLKVDWESVEKGDQPRRSVYTLEFQNGLYILQALGATVVNICKDELSQEALAERVSQFVVKHSTATANGKPAVSFDGITCVIEANLEQGGRGQFLPDEVQAKIEQLL